MVATDRRTPSGSASRRLALPLLVVALGLSLSVAPGVASPSGSRGGAAPDRPWSGYPVAATGDASGGWIGARKVGRRGGRVVYRVDPAADARTGGLKGARLVARLRGPGARSSASPARTARAAWILAKYGTYREPGQSAAVDAAVLHLLAGGRFRLRGRDSMARVRETGEADRVWGLAVTMLRAARRRAGPYRVVTAQMKEAEVGQAVQVAMAAVVARSGLAVPSVPVQVRVAPGRWHAIGETNADGRAAYAVPGLSAGPHQLDVRVRRLPETRLLLMQPRRAGGSRDVVAGRKGNVVVGLRVVVLAVPRLGVSARRITRGARTSGLLRITGAYGRTARSATAVLHGPFGSRGQTGCQRKELRERQVRVSGNGSFDLPRLSLQRAGHYVWHVGLPGDVYHRPASVCAGAFRVARR